MTIGMFMLYKALLEADLALTLNSYILVDLIHLSVHKLYILSVQD